MRRTAFEQIGGFDERYYVSEELHLSRALKHLGPFRIVRPPVVTSARKMRMYSGWQLLRWSVRLLFLGPRAWRKREGLEMWYDGRREEQAREKGDRSP